MAVYDLLTFILGWVGMMRKLRKPWDEVRLLKLVMGLALGAVLTFLAFVAWVGFVSICVHVARMWGWL
jgi:hypothetical protein